jgi:hypothetical protein
MRAVSLLAYLSLSLLQIVDPMNSFYVVSAPESFILASSVALMVYGGHAFLTRHDASHGRIT